MEQAPTAPPQRIVGYDVARALAIFGMILVNFKLVMGATDNGPAWLTWLSGLLEGRAAATFVILAGVGIALLSKKGRVSGDHTRIRRDRITLAKRAVFLFIFGLAYSPIWPADILHFYGLYMLVAVALLTVPDKWLWRWSAVFVSIAFMMLLMLDFEAGWNFDDLEYTDFWTPVGMVRHMLYNGFHPVFPWTAFLLIGMWLGRQDMLNPQVQGRMLRWALGIAIVTEGVSYVLTAGVFNGDEDAGYVFGTQMIPPFPLYIVAASATAVAVIVLCVRLAQNLHDAKWLWPLIATGQLALTLYVAHVLVGMGLMEAFGWLQNDEPLWLAIVYSTVFYGACVVFATWWRNRYKRGPLEWVMRRVTS